MGFFGLGYGGMMRGGSDSMCFAVIFREHLGVLWTDLVTLMEVEGWFSSGVLVVLLRHGGGVFGGVLGSGLVEKGDGVGCC